MVRCFDDANITHVENSVDPVRDAEIINLELNLADLQTVENRIGKIEKKSKTTKDKDAVAEMALLNRLKPLLEEGKPARVLEVDEDEAIILKGYNLLTAKPMIYVANLDEEGVMDPSANAYYNQLVEYASSQNNEVVALCAKMEEELSELDKEEKTAFLNELGVDSSGLDLLIQKAYSVLNLCTFLTAGEDECRAWTFKKGMKAPDCAGVIHTDFKKGFIRAEVYRFEDIDELESEHAIKEAGRLRLEGKDYVVQDGDVMHFRFNV